MASGNGERVRTRSTSELEIAKWDMSPENLASSKYLYIEVYRCEICDEGLPYPKASHDCTSDMELDEGFEECIGKIN